MASEAPSEQVVIVRAPLWQRVLKWVGIALVALALLAVALVFGINTQPGRRFLANTIGGYTLASGLNVTVGRIDGSIYGAMVLRDVRVRDQQGVFLTSPAIAVDWRPFAFVNNHADVKSATARLITMARMPVLKPTPVDPNAPTLPSLDIDVGRLKIDRFVMRKPVTGQAHIVAVDGLAHIADRRAQVSANVVALAGRGIAGGDRLAVKLDAVPDDNKLDIDAKLDAPAGGVVATIGKLTAPLDLTVNGKGSWKAWNGKVAGTLGGASLADLTLTANDGTFKLRGNAHPGLYPGGAPKDKATPVNPVARLTAPQLDIALDAVMNKRVVDTRLTLRSDALALAGQGRLDLAASKFGQFKVDAKLLTPGAIAPNLNGRDVAASVVLDGPFATPTVNYVVQGAQIGFGAIRVDNVYASGLATVDAKHIMIPVNARASRVVGLNAAAGGLLQNVAINGSFAISGDKVLSDNLRIRSSKIDATALVVADLSTGMYRGALNGKVNNYRVEGFGIVSLATNAKLVTAPKGGFGITGHVVARTSQIFNEGARNFLGGNAIVKADVGYDPTGIITFRNLRLAAPDFSVTRGEGRYDPAGPLAVNADAYSKQYGPLFARVTGTIAKPVVLLRAPRPGVGVGLVNLEAQVRGTGSAYAIVAKGGTNYGPFTADVVAATAPALTVDIRRIQFAGVVASGKVQQMRAGPFAGRVQFAGSGIAGAAVLGAQGAVQRADIAATATNAKIPGQTAFTIGRAIIKAQAILYPKAPQVIADAQIGNLRYDAAVITAARAKVNYAGGAGTAQLLANGSSGVPFRLAANAKLSPKLWLAALQGQANGIDFKTANPARIAIDGGSYTLQPTRIDFGGASGGSARIAGSYGKGMTVQARLDRMDLTMVNALVPNLGLGGTATGGVDFSQPSGASFPQATARLSIANFTRASLATVSEPVGIVFVGKLLPDGGDARAIVTRGGTTVGRMVATLRPLGSASGSWTSRLMSAPLAGGIRYNGPSAVLFSLAGLADQQLSGPIAVAADFSGRVSAPQLNGLIRADNLTYDNDTYGTRLTNMKIAGRFTNDRLDITQMSAKAGDGTVQAQGSVGFAADSGFPINIQATLNKAQLAKSDALGATASGTLKITNSKADGGRITGDIRIPNARYEIVTQGQAEVLELTGVRRKSDLVKAAAAEQAPPAAPPVGLFQLDIRVRAPDQLFVSGMGLESEWSADMRVSGSSANPKIVGKAEIVRGTYTFSGKRFDIDHGIVRFNGGALSDPTLDISATTTVDTVSAIIAIGGTGQHPQITFTSTPTLPQDEVLSRLLFGTSVTDLSATEAIQLAAALNSLRGGGGGLNPLGKLRSATGFDRLRIVGGDKATGQGTSLAAGKYITKNIYVEIITDARGFTATQLEIALAKGLSALSQAGTFGSSNVSVRYKRDF
ncbi:translocation/assembly module TamB domain-containing protein [Sphingomonas sp. NFR15]|uniref:translocation/assembly module TamB domain-containing protein n=1 Tax=Sphingomonas sp. NFR15 TaxID=1566282 RepID=UPI000883BCED|nr:translocation/assembly module TamB domain-containing protein [Sphingomonas sp. NFR15]SDA12951.1 translocation and assembly module TamB [Sphingomonas sp. NFR15]